MRSPIDGGRSVMMYIVQSSFDITQHLFFCNVLTFVKGIIVLYCVYMHKLNNLLTQITCYPSRLHLYLQALDRFYDQSNTLYFNSSLNSVSQLPCLVMYLGKNEDEILHQFSFLNIPARNKIMIIHNRMVFKSKHSMVTFYVLNINFSINLGSVVLLEQKLGRKHLNR